MTHLTDQLEGFKHEHGRLLKELNRLDRFLGTLSVGDADPALILRALKQLQRLIKERIIPHCSRERRVFSPLLQKQGLDRGQLVRAILIEDRLLEREYQKLEHALGELNAGTKRAVETLVSTGERIIAMLIEHIHQEETLLFPLLRRTR